MPRRRQKTRANNGASAHDIEALRRAIGEGFPWLLHTGDNKGGRRSGLTLRQGILLSHVTGIVSGAGIFLAEQDHPSRDAVAAVRAELQDDIDEAEKRFKTVFTGQRHEDGFSSCTERRKL